MYKIY